jgi:hypothetical protein
MGKLTRNLGRRRQFWEFLLAQWNEKGCLKARKFDKLQQDILWAFFGKEKSLFPCRRLKGR